MDWAERIGIGIAADIVASTPRKRLETESVRRLVRMLNGVIDPTREDTEKVLASLPPEAIRALMRAYKRRYVWVHPDSPREYEDAYNARRSLIRNVLSLLLEGQEPPVLKARLLSHHILYGELDARDIEKLARSLFRGPWECTSFADLDGDVEALRRIGSPVADCFRAAHSIATIHLGDMFCADQLENFLKRALFAWPLLTIGREGGGCSLPVGVDLELNRAPEWRRVDAPGVKHATLVADQEESKLTVEWEQSLELATIAAKRAWLSKHGGSGQRMKDAVVNARVVYDFRWAEEVLTHDLPRVELHDRSAELYFSQVVLARLLGRRRGILAATTGVIDNRVKNEDGKFTPDYEIGPLEDIEGIGAKIPYVIRTSFSDRIALPVPRDKSYQLPRPGAAVAVTGVPVDVRYGERLSNVTDIVQPEGWRQHKYLRADDICWWVHDTPGRKKRLRDDEEQHQFWFDVLKGNPSRVAMVECADPAAAAQTLAGALFKLNLKLWKKAPWMSWTLVRMVEHEQDLRFLKTVASACGASASAWQRVRSSMSWEDAARNMASILNRFDESLEAPAHRAPDLLVLLGYEVVKDKQPENPMHRSFLIPEVLWRLEKHLRGLPERAHTRFTGRTRVIILTSKEGTEYWPGHKVQYAPPARKYRQRPIQIDPEDIAPLTRLSAFQFGFSHLGGALVLRTLDMSGEEALETLERLVEKGVLREGQGHYFMPDEVRRCLPAIDKTGVKDMAQAHYAAGSYYVPYFRPEDFPAISASEAFRPWHIHEGAWQFRHALDLFRTIRDRSMESKCRKAARMISVYCEERSWGNVEDLLQARSEAKEAQARSESLLESARSSEQPLHPRWLLATADSNAERGVQLARGGDANGTKEGRKLLEQASRLYEEAIEAAEHEVFADEATYNRIQTRTFYARYLFRMGGGDVRVERRVISLIDEALEISRSNNDARALKAVPGEIWEYLGDRMSDDTKAVAMYTLGCEHSPKWRQLWLKRVGALIGSGADGNMAEVIGHIEEDPQVTPKSLIAAERILKKHASVQTETGLRGFQRLLRGLRRIQNEPFVRPLRPQIKRVIASASTHFPNV